MASKKVRVRVGLRQIVACVLGLGLDSKQMVACVKGIRVKLQADDGMC